MVEEIYTEPMLVEVCDTGSYYFGESFLVTYKTHALGRDWFKCERAGAAPRGLSLWFNITELEFTN